MFDFDKLREAYQMLGAEKDPTKHSQMTTMFVMTAIAFSVYYIAAATCIIVLGRRLIQASFAAFKEARRERA